MLNTTDSIYHTVLEELLSAPIRGDRTGTGTMSLFGKQLRFTNLHDRFPLVTTKSVFFKGVFHELKWMLMGETNIKYLVDNRVSIWTDWPLKYYNQSNPDLPLTKDDFEESIRTNHEGFASMWGDCGPVYGYQWRNWIGPKHISSDQAPFDQIEQAINDLKYNPESRRIIVTAWNVADIDEMAISGLPPCHMFMQFYTRPINIEERCKLGGIAYNADPEFYRATLKYLEDKDVPTRYLDCQVYLRSNDFLLGAPFNIAQYALLTTFMAKTVNMIPGDLVYTMGDCHLYVNHVDQAREQLSRVSTGKEPTLFVNNTCEDPADYKWQDLHLEDYRPHGAIKAPIAV